MKTNSKKLDESHSAESIIVDGMNFLISETSAALVSGLGTRGIVRIPLEVSGISVTSIENEAFAENDQLTDIELPAGIERIGARAFRACTSLQSVVLPYDLRRIESEAFAGCSALAELPHFVGTGPTDERKVVRSIVEHALPVTLQYLGERAFENCYSLKKAVIPFQVKEIGSRAYAGCSSLENLWLNSGLEEIATGAFYGCDLLSEVHVPESVVFVGVSAFPTNTTLICSAGSPADLWAKDTGLEVRNGGFPKALIDSSFGRETGYTVSKLLGSPADLEAYLDLFENRPALDEFQGSVRGASESDVNLSRFHLDGDVYRLKDSLPQGDVTISMVGDLMCGFRQQVSSLRDGVYDFTENFRYVQPLLEKYDLSIGNLESMFADAYPYMHERKFVDDRPHLNSPFAFLTAVRNAGFDVVMNAQNHMYDTGMKGILQTLDSLNRAELIHCGLYAGEDESRYTMIEIKGMRIALVAYLDPIRQKMKQHNFTAAGLAAAASLLDAEKVAADISLAKAAGAEFVLAYCHWGNEYTDTIAKRQVDFARMVANAGADYIFGSHSHCPQHYTTVRSSDGRIVPVVYSGGNFIADIQRKKPITQDSFIGSLTLTRDGNQKVVVKNDGFIPAKIIDHLDIRGFSTVVPSEVLVSGDLDYSILDAEADKYRIKTSLGAQYRQLDLDLKPVDVSPVKGDDLADKLVEKFSIREPRFTPLSDKSHSERAKHGSRFVPDEETHHWKQTESGAKNEAVILCAGLLSYDRAIEQTASLDREYDFRPAFKSLRSCFETADLAIASLNSVVADNFPSIATLGGMHVAGHYANARKEYLDGIKFAGFDCLALANPYNLDAGVRGIASTEEAVRAASMIPSGLGSAKSPIIDVNDIKIAVLSFSMELYRTRTMITDAGASELLNGFTAEKVEAAARAAREQGAQFILGYLDCSSSNKPYSRAQRLESAKIMAEAGFDYVICSRAMVVSRIYVHETLDKRRVPIATSLGTLVSGSVNPKHSESALLRLVVRITAEGAIDVDQSYIPIQRYAPVLEGFPTSLPMHPFYKSHLGTKAISDTTSRVSYLLGTNLKLDRSRTISIASDFQPNLTPEEICQALGTEFSPSDADLLRTSMQSRIPGIVTRKGDVKAGCAVVLVKHTSSRRHLDQMVAADAASLGARFVISEAPQKGIPTLVVENAWRAYKVLMKRIRRRYNPITVAITGTAGKTTTKELMGGVFDRNYQTMHIAGNNNTLTTASLVLQKLRASDEAYIQEVNGGTPRSASQVSRLIRPDIAVITAIGEGHLDQMGSIENIIKGKMQITDGLKPDGVLILNNDNEYLRAQDPPVRTIRYSISDSSCDYFARNIQNSGDDLVFEVVCADGAFEVLLHAQGLHNVGNALAVFAASREAGIAPHRIVAGLSRYQTASIRQNLVEVGGYRLLIDAYNSNILSMGLALEALTTLSLADGGRRIVVMGDMGEQGTKLQENHEAIGTLIGELPVDLLLCIGEGSRFTAEKARLTGMKVLHFDNFEHLILATRDSIRPGDAILFKAAGSVKLSERVIFPLFGTIV
ncbi:hypothetical protein CIK76_12765 [Glutamicibacter sp. BW80]|uniref:CapA family protein n=1 Tax=Glutamicibacter sp. BW80 TaxID=2024404 RepID=UPI000BB7A51F|nr:CapA family protein [Glutamicibacter sp. BW80]PCC28142.1 hypothetical protein CIK76_12765 [Glutamicibacter sp. BW80]